MARSSLFSLRNSGSSKILGRIRDLPSYNKIRDRDLVRKSHSGIRYLGPWNTSHKGNHARCVPTRNNLFIFFSLVKMELHYPLVPTVPYEDTS